MPGLLHHNAMPEDREENAPERTTSTRGAAGASAPAAPGRSWSAPGGPYARCDGCDVDGRPRTCLPAHHPQKGSAAQCPRCEHEWEDLSSGQRRCRRCVLIVTPQRRLF